MPNTVGGYWGTSQFARDLPLPVVRSTYPGQSFTSTIQMIPGPHEAGDTLIIVLVMRFSQTAVLVSRPANVTEIFHYNNPAGSDSDATQLFVFRREMPTPDYTPMVFTKNDSTSFFNGACHAVIGAGPIENLQHAIGPAPKVIPPITTTKPNCLLFFAWTARWGLDQFIPMPPAPAEWEGVGAAYITIHWNTYQRDALIPGTYGPTQTVGGYSGDQMLVMQVSPRPAPPTPDLTLSVLTPWSGVLAGGTTVTVTGTGFAVGATSVTIGSTTIPAANVTVLSGTQLTFVTPAGPGGVKSVQALTVTVGGYTSNKLSFTYNAAGTFTPASVSGVGKTGMKLGTMDVWLDASEPSTVTRSGSNVTHWLDLSLNRYDFFAYDPSRYPQYTGTVQGRNVITFTADLVQSDTQHPGERPRTYFVVANPTPGVESNLTGTGNSFPYIRSNTSNLLWIHAGIDVVTTASSTGLHVWTVEFNANNSRVWKDGTLVWSGNPGSAMQPNTWQIGTMTGVMAEFISYRKVLSDTERADVENYLLGRWTGPAVVPDAPTTLAGTAGNAQVVLTWAAPAYNGGASITDYRVEYAVSPPGTAWTLFADGVNPATGATVTGLTNGTSYVFRVAAINSVGTGAWSSTSAALSPSAPTAPGAPVLTDATPGNTNVALTWTAPAFTGGVALTGYRIDKSPDGTTGWTTAATVGLVLTTIVGSLTNGTIQHFRVSAINSVGTGSPSNVLSATPTAGGGGTWMQDFTVMPDGVPAGWTTVDGEEVGNATVKSGKFRCPEDWWYTAAVYTGQAATGGHCKLRAELEWTAASEFGVWICNAADTLRNGIVFHDNGNWDGQYQGGFNGPSGTYTLPAINTPFTVEVEWTQGTPAPVIVRLNGTQIGSGSFDNPATGARYGRLSLDGKCGCRKFTIETV